jgi:hypothetical protein
MFSISLTPFSYDFLIRLTSNGLNPIALNAVASAATMPHPERAKLCAISESSFYGSKAVNWGVKGLQVGSDRVKFTLNDAFWLGLDYVKRRIDRAVLNIASIALSIAFLSYLMLSNSFYQAFSSAGGERLGVEAYQYWLMLVALLVSVVGITNSMLISVYERYKEIGTMKCIGALDRHILLLFLVEASIQGALGGVAGTLLGFVIALFSAGLTTGLGIIFKIPLLDFVFSVFGSALLSVLLSIVATLYPAYRAAKLNPVEALSYEL